MTGASRGIGAGIARALATAGADVVVTYWSSPDIARRLVDELRACVQADAIRADAGLSDAEPIRQRLEGISAFNRMRGGEYLFLPSKAALDWIGAGDWN